jgi:hypothetical protein
LTIFDYFSRLLPFAQTNLCVESLKNRRKEMAKFHLSWEVAEERLTDDVKQIARGWSMLLSMVKEDLESGLLKDWGASPGEHSGYAVMEGSEMDIMKLTIKYTPHIKFKVMPVVSAGQLAEFLSTVAG